LNRFLIFFWVVLFLVLPGLLFFESCFESVFVFLRGCATRLAKSKQPLSHSARAAAAATQPLCQSGCRSHSTTQPLRVAEWLSGWSSRSYQSGWVAEWLPQPLCQSGWVLPLNFFLGEIKNISIWYVWLLCGATKLL
jgi:hypothetical protein